MLLLMLAEESVEVEGEDVPQSPPPAIHREQLGLLKHYPLKKVGDIVAQGHKKSSDLYHLTYHNCPKYSQHTLKQ